MRRKPTFRSLFWAAVQVSIGAVLLFQLASWRLGTQTPGTAGELGVALAETPVGHQGTIPATFTPLPSPTPAGDRAFTTPAATSTLPPAVVMPVAALPPTPTATPYSAPDYLRRQVKVYQVAEPPSETDCTEFGTVFRSEYPNPLGSPLSYHLYLPPCYGQDGRVYPVLYLMHGSGHTDAQWVDLGVPQHMDEGLREGRYPPMIIVMPWAGPYNDTTSGGERSVEGIMLNSLIPWVDANFCTWANREGRSIGGISRGGYWALMLAFRHVELFGAVSGHSSQLRLDVDPAQYNPRATYAAADLSNTRIWMDWGEHDFLRPGQFYLHESLMNAGVAHQVNIFPGGHANYYWFDHLHYYLDWHAQSWPTDRSQYAPCQR